MTDVNPNKIDHLQEPDSVCMTYKSEMKGNFQKPILKKGAITRAHRMEQFLWHELYDEYIRSKERQKNRKPCPPTTEYYDIFGKPAPHNAERMRQTEEHRDVIVNRYPLYATNAITAYNHSGDFTCNFRRKANITIPATEQRGKFDELNG